MIKKTFKVELLLDEENNLDIGAFGLEETLKSFYCEKGEKVLNIKEVKNERKRVFKKIE